MFIKIYKGIYSKTIYLNKSCQGHICDVFLHDFNNGLQMFSVVLALLVAITAAAPDNGWSWGSDDKVEKPKAVAAVEEPKEEQGRSPRQQFDQESSSSAVDIHANDFNEPLPLEPHTESVAPDPKPGASADPNREPRFLGISDTLCDWGVGISVSTILFIKHINIIYIKQVLNIGSSLH